MAGTSAGAKKAAATRSNQNRRTAAQKAAKTRKENDPNAFRKMGEKGGSHFHKSRSSSDE
jgi:hypothetical protein